MDGADLRRFGPAAHDTDAQIDLEKVKKMKMFAGPGRPLNPDDPLDPTFNPDEEPSYPEADPEEAPMPDQPLYVPPAIAPIKMY